MEITIKCPDCGKEVKLTVETAEEKTSTVQVTRQTEKGMPYSEVVKAIRDGRAEEILNIGDTLKFELTNGKTLKMQVAAFNPYGENTVALVSEDCPFEDKIHGENYKGGWEDSEIRKYLNEELYSLLPSDVKKSIVERTIKQKVQGKNVETKDNLWIPSLTEVGFLCDSDIEDVKFELFRNEKSRVKEHDGETWYWWLRSPYASSSYIAYGITASGTTSGDNADRSYGVAPACIIG